MAAPQAAPRYRWTILAAGVVGQASFSAILLGLPSIAPQIRHGYGLTLTQVGVVLAALNFGLLVTLLPWGIVADRIGERAVLATGLAGCAAALAAAWSAGAGVGVALLRSETQPQEDDEDPSPPLRNPRIWRLCIASTFYVVSQISLVSFLVLFLHDARGVSTATAAGVLATTQI